MVFLPQLAGAGPIAGLPHTTWASFVRVVPTHLFAFAEA